MDEISINTDTAGVQHQPAVAGFRGTQFAVVWADHASGDIKGRMIGVNGVPTGNAFPVNYPGTPGTKRQCPAILETGAGLVVAWTEQPPGPPQTTPSHVKLRTFEADTLSGPESQVSTTEVEKAIRPALARLPDGGFIVVWADKRQEERIRAQRYGFDGTKSGPEFRVNTVPGFHWVPMVACLTSGNIVIAWRARVPGPLMIHLQMFDANGPLGTEQTTVLHATEAAMSALDSGRFVIAHIRNAGDSEPGFDTTVAQVSVFEANGAFANIRFAATGDNRIRSDWPTLAALPGGRFHAGLDRAECRQPRHRCQCRGQNFLGPGTDRPTRPGQRLDGRTTIRPEDRRDVRPRGRDGLPELDRREQRRPRHVGARGRRTGDDDTCRGVLARDEFQSVMSSG